MRRIVKQLSALMLCICMLVGLASCASRPQLANEFTSSTGSGEIIAIERVGGYSELFADIILWITGMSDRVPASYGFDLYRMTYWTAGEDRQLTPATALVTIPRAEDFKGVLGWLHGTAVTRDLVPSTPTPDEGVLVSVAFAGHGYILIAPDYLGFGGSTTNHPYYHAPSAASTVRDAIVATEKLIRLSNLAWPEDLFLTGFSQGGYNTIVATRDIESNPIPNIDLQAAAPIAGPFDLAGFSVPNALKGESPSASLYLAYMINSYARIYSEDIGSLAQEPYATQIPVLFDGLHSGDEVVAALPEQPRDLFHPQVWDDFEQGNFRWLGDRLRENSTHQFVPDTPIRLYYGSEDLDVSPQEATDQIQRWQAAGLSMQAVDVGPFDHNESVIEAAP
ncbi:MAG: hypothetical protein MI746_15615, partial [Pseudomonadales bacterium]|nr:hypothetical protein [Pseudomonadales bacterium]